MIVVVIILVLLLAASVFFNVKFYKSKPQAADPVQIATKEILNHDVGAVLIVSDSDQVLYYNNEFEVLFPKIGSMNTITEQPAMKKLFAAREYVSEELSKIYEIRSEWLSTENFSGRFVWLTDITGHYKTNKKLQELKDMADAANKAKTYLEDKMQKSFEAGISKTQGYLDRANTAMTTIGNRSARVELVGNRLSSQQSSFEELTSDNDDVDITETAVKLSSVEMTYEAALMATGKITQTTLLNYI